MKKLMAVLLVLVMVVNLCGVAFASSQYDSTLMKIMDKTAAEWMEDDSMQLVCAAIMLLDYIIISGVDYMDLLEVISTKGNGYIANYEGSVDLYLRRTDGDYFNLLYSPATQTIIDFGSTSSKPTSNKCEYVSISMSSFGEAFEAAVETVAEIINED